MSVSVSFYGDGPLAPPNNECIDCDNFFHSEWFPVAPAQTITLDEYSDFNSSSGIFPVDVLLFGGGSCASGCTGTQAEALCAFLGTTAPIWWLIEFNPGGTKIGNPGSACGPPGSWDDPNSSFTANWQVTATKIIVTFDD